MKVACPNCKQALKVPDDWAGRTARCPHCKGPFSVPGPAPSPVVAPQEPGAVDLKALADLVPEERTSAPAEVDAPPTKRGRWARQKPAAEQPKKRPTAVRGADGKIYRLCPACGHQVSTEDPYMDLLCSNCGMTIPGTTKVDEIDLPKGQTLIGGHGQDIDRTVGFYDGLVLAFGYPIGALESILMGTAVAISVIVVPMAIIMGLVAVMKMEPVEGDKFSVGTWPGMMMGGMLLLQLIYCAGVGFYALIDSIRSTNSGAEKPPQLVFNLATVAGGLVSYIGFVIFYGLLAVLGIRLLGHWPGQMPTTLDKLQGLLGAGVYVYLAILTFFMPITIIGLAVGKGLQGLNPVRMVRSIASTAPNYAFLYCIMLVYAGLVGIALTQTLAYTGQSIADVYRKGIEQSAGSMAIGVVFWGLLMAGGFYGQYVLGRILGLFAREYQFKLAYTS
jgi:DNA-directed RNA polymerase subunit RPC12/RpoP